jgi:hypothetical protein
MSKIVVALACTLPLILVGCGGGTSSAPLLTSPATPVTAPAGAPSTGSSKPTTQTITFNSASLPLGSTVPLQGSASSGLPVVYASQTPNICSVSGNNVTGVSLGSCTLTANQAGNASFTAAPQSQIIISVLNAQKIQQFTELALSLGQLTILNPMTTSGLPIQITSLTPATCIVGQNVAIYGVATGTCTLQATQYGNEQFAAADPLTLTTTITPSNTTLAKNAVLATWIANPQTGSTALDPNTTIEGIYNNSSGAFALIDGDHHFDYFDYYGLLFSSFSQSSSAWTLSNSIYYSKVAASTTSSIANGSFSAKQTFTGINQSFSTVTPLVDLTYTKDNGYAASLSSIKGSWFYNDGSFLFNMNISNTGIITGTEVDGVGGACNLNGSVTQPTSQHNMYSISLATTNASGAFCNLNTTSPYIGLAALSFLPAGSQDSNGFLPSFTLFAQDASTQSPIKLVFFQQ